MRRSVSSTDRPTGRSLMVIWRKFWLWSMMKSPRKAMPSSSFNTPYLNTASNWSLFVLRLYKRCLSIFVTNVLGASTSTISPFGLIYQSVVLFCFFGVKYFHLYWNERQTVHATEPIFWPTQLYSSRFFNKLTHLSVNLEHTFSRCRKFCLPATGSSCCPILLVFLACWSKRDG